MKTIHLLLTDEWINDVYTHTHRNIIQPLKKDTVQYAMTLVYFEDCMLRK